MQGIRITLNSAGQPAIWEVLADGSGAELIFVSQSLEAAALAEFGKPLPGRRYAIERSVEEAPSVVVARVIDDGPMAHGADRLSQRRHAGGQHAHLPLHAGAGKETPGNRALMICCHSKAIPRIRS